GRRREVLHTHHLRAGIEPIAHLSRPLSHRLDMGDRGLADELAVGRRDRLGEFGQGHPIDAHGFTPLLDREVRNPLVELAPAVPSALAIDADRALAVAYVTAIDANRSPRAVVAGRHEAHE